MIRTGEYTLLHAVGYTYTLSRQSGGAAIGYLTCSIARMGLEFAPRSGRASEKAAGVRLLLWA